MSHEHNDEEKSICDFCGSEKIRWAYPADDFMMGAIAAVGPNGEMLELQPMGSSGPWAACEKCSELIEHNDYEALKRHAIEVNVRAGVDINLSRVLLANLHGGFRAHRTGPRMEIA
jgi:hypothetical protein